MPPAGADSGATLGAWTHSEGGSCGIRRQPYERRYCANDAPERSPGAARRAQEQKAAGGLYGTEVNGGRSEAKWNPVSIVGLALQKACAHSASAMRVG